MVKIRGARGLDSLLERGIEVAHGNGGTSQLSHVLYERTGILQTLCFNKEAGSGSRLDTRHSAIIRVFLREFRVHTSFRN